MACGVGGGERKVTEVEKGIGKDGVGVGSGEPDG